MRIVLSLILFIIKKILASIVKKNIFGTQFHPEISGDNGMKVYESFFKNMKMTTKYGLPKKLVTCKICVMTNQKPHSINETQNKNSKTRIRLQ